MVDFLLGLLSSIILAFATALAQAIFKRKFEKEQKNHPVLYVWLRTRDSSTKKIDVNRYVSSYLGDVMA